jgi:hypothetical protein
VIPDAELRDFGLAPLPPAVQTLLSAVDAPPRLVAHLALVHDVANQLLDDLERNFPGLVIDREEVLFGAATHDIGKAVARYELAEPGDEHELLGQRLLISHGVSPALARFAATHADLGRPEVQFTDAIVALADKVWKGKRDKTVEEFVLKMIAEALGLSPWEAFDRLDGVLETIAEDAARRLEFQGRFPT